MKNDEKKPSLRQEGEDKFATAAGIALIVCVVLFLIAEIASTAFCLSADDKTIRAFMNKVGENFGVVAWGIVWFLVICCVAGIVVRFVRFPPRWK